MRRLQRLEQQPPVLDADVLAGEIHRLAGKQRLVDRQEFMGDVIALVMRQKHAVALVLDRIAAGDDVDQKPPIGNPVERRRHPRRDGRREEARADGDEIAKLLGQRRQGRGDHPAVFAGASRRQEDAEIAEVVGSLRDLPQIVRD